MKPAGALKFLCILAAVAIILSASMVPWNVKAEPGEKLKEKFRVDSNLPRYGSETDESDGTVSGGKSYFDIQKEYKEKGYQPAKNIEIVLKPESLVPPPGGSAPAVTEIAGKNNAILWDENREYIEWLAEIPEDGLYEIIVEYYPLGDSSVTIERSLMIDGETPFQELYSIYFNRVWRDEGEPKVNNIGDEVRPRQIEERMWQKFALTDHQGMYSEPFRFYLARGAHRIKLVYVEGEMGIGDVIIRSPEEIPPYEEVLKEYKDKGYKDAGQTIRFEAENTVVGKSDPTVRRESDSDPMTTPVSTTSRKLNIMGGWGWRRGNQSITWKFTVPEDGLYKIGLRVAQWYGDGLPVYRQIMIDGKVPFRELKEYKFVYNKYWNLEVLGDPEDGPYLFYLEKGEHELTMTVKVGPLRDIIREIHEDTLLLSDVIRQIVMLTGSEPDPNFEYELHRNIPGLLDNLTRLSDSMEEKARVLTEMSAKRPAMANNFLMISDQMKKMVRDPHTIPLKLNDLNNALNSLGLWSLSLQDHALAVDSFVVSRPDEELVNKRSNIFQKIIATLQNFFLSFTKDYNNIGSVYENQTETRSVIDVWIARGMEWAGIIKEMADEDFTPRTGISIKIKVLPPSQLDTGSANALLLAICSGKAPDVALSISANSPVEFAIREAVVDLSRFDDFDQVKQRFLPKIMIPFEYKGGIYALPETMNFKALFYRRDIIEELGVSIPNTWEDVYQHLLPVLYQHGMQFYYAPDLSTFLFQRGGEFYRDEGRRSALDSPEAFQAFREFVELYTNYNIPVTANFFNRMRLGEMPIGVGDYSLYVQLSVAAPELAGRWEIAPLPGHVREDGSIDRSTGGIVSTANIILDQSTKKDDAWEFLKWLTSDEIQTKFGRELEALIGVQARWNTANVNAFKKMPWNKQHLKVIEQQWEWATEMPVVLGGYFTGRHINNAWNRVVLGEMNVRDSLELAVKDINRELRSKQAEYGFIIEE